MESNERDSRSYWPELDVLRAFAFLSVFVAHWLPDDPADYAQRRIPPKLGRLLLAASQTGGTGVMLFFALSSYLITKLLLRELEKRGQVNVRAFYVRRVLRIWPLYLVFTIFAALLPCIDASQRFGWTALLGFVFFSGNWLWACGVPLHTVAVPLWSVSVEEQFYLVWPWVVRRATTRKLWRVALGLPVVAAVARALVVFGVVHVDLWHNTFTQLDSIALGAMLALGLDRMASRLRGRRPLVAITALVALFVVHVLRQAPVSRIDVRDLLYYPVVSVCCATILFSFIGANVNTSSPVIRALIWLGKISFGLYVVHNFTFYGVEKLLALSPVKLGSLANFVVRGALAMTGSIVLASISYRWLEEPFLRLKRRFSS